MIKPPPDWVTLSAYVDGELDPAGAAAVADAAGRDANVVDTIAQLYRLKGVCHASAPVAPANLADLLPQRRPLRRTVAAAAAVVVVAGCVAWLGLSIMPGDAPPADMLAVARTLHSEWLAIDAAEVSQPHPVALLAALSRFGQVPLIPTLEGSELAVGLVTVADGPNGQILQVGYRGTQGCHLSLFVFAGGQQPELRFVDAGVERAIGWRVHDLAYLLFAEGMDESRFALIAEKVEEATRRNAPLDGEAQQQLAENKRTSASCQA